VSELGRAAVAYARHAVPVFPVVPRGKRPLTDHGVLDATTDETQVSRWWARWPNANIGLATGVVFDVLDIDSPEVAGWLEQHAPGWRGPGPVSITAKGEHRLYAPTGNSNRARVAGVPIDVRARGGYICAPPSVHDSGHVYRWLTPPSAPLPEMPAALVSLLWPPPPPRQSRRVPTRGGWSPAGLIRTMARAVEGQRNATLHWCAARIGEDVSAGKVDEDTAIDAIGQLADVARRTGLDYREIGATIRSGYRP
jgi:hypothetical protein